MRCEAISPSPTINNMNANTDGLVPAPVAGRVFGSTFAEPPLEVPPPDALPLPGALMVIDCLAPKPLTGA